MASTPDPCCIDCGRPYSLFSLDVILPRSQWLEIHPADGGLLCANCIVTRASRLPSAIACHLVIEIAVPNRPSQKIEDIQGFMLQLMPYNRGPGDPPGNAWVYRCIRCHNFLPQGHALACPNRSPRG